MTKHDEIRELVRSACLTDFNVASKALDKAVREVIRVRATEVFDRLGELKRLGLIESGRDTLLMDVIHAATELYLDTLDFALDEGMTEDLEELKAIKTELNQSCEDFKECE